MFIENKNNSTPMFGVIAMKDKIRFNDCDIFKGDTWKYSILKNKIMVGFSKSKRDIQN